MSAAEKLDPERLRAALPTGWDVLLVAETGSTNMDLANQADRGAAGAFRVLVAEQQNAGRGRRNRTWHSEPGAGLTFSVLLHPRGVRTDRWGWLPLLAGLAVTEGLANCTPGRLGLKWPNDVLDEHGAKVAGLLGEQVRTPAGAMAVIGLGLNVSAVPPGLPAGSASCLAQLGCTRLDRHEVFGAVLAALDRRYRDWVDAAGDAGACGVAEAYGRASVTVGRPVRVDLGGGEHLAGQAEAIEAGGELRLRTPAGARVVTAGDVVHLDRSG